MTVGAKRKEDVGLLPDLMYVRRFSPPPESITETALAALEEVWGRLAFGQRLVLRRAFTRAIFDARQADLAHTKPAPDRRMQRAAQRKVAELAGQLVDALRQASMGPWGNSLATRINVYSVIERLRAASVASGELATEKGREATTRTRRGRPTASWLDSLILAMWVVYEDLGGTPSASWRDGTGDRLTPFVRGAAAFIASLPPDIRTPSAKAIGERVHRLRRKLRGAKFKSRAG